MLLEYLDEIAAGGPSSNEVIVYGPRGNGKTVLLRWLENHIQTVYGTSVDVLWLTPDDIPTRALLRSQLLPDTLLDKLLPDQVALGPLRWSLDQQPDLLTKGLAVRAKKKPLVILLDEAHTLDISVGRTLLNLSQKIGSACPFLLTLAGTPDLKAHLNKMNATFWSRSEKVGIGRLTPTAAREALTTPLNEEGVGVEPNVLAHIVQDSQRYPFFLQLWGKALWREVYADGTQTIRMNHVPMAEAQVNIQKKDYYQDRYEELKTQSLLTAAAAVADAFVGQSRLDEAALEQAILAGLGTDATHETRLAVRTALRHLGFIWQPVGEDTWEPGIPSLMDYIQAKVSSGAGLPT